MMGTVTAHWVWADLIGKQYLSKMYGNGLMCVIKKSFRNWDKGTPKTTTDQNGHDHGLGLFQRHSLQYSK